MDLWKFIESEVGEMPVGLIGRKCGMTRIFTEDGVSIPVSVIEVQPNRVAQVKSVETDGYLALQVTTGARRATRVNKALAGHFAKAKIEAGRGLWEFTASEKEIADAKMGDELTVELFKEGQVVDVTGISKGKGFAGVVKRHNFSTQNKTHGNSLTYRSHGSTGMCQTPGRVIRGKRMAGHLGSERCTIQNQEIVKIDKVNNLLLIKGAIPGAKNGDLVIVPAKKKEAN